MDREILSELLAQGLKNGEIAERLGVSLRTVQTYRKEYRMRKQDGWSPLNGAFVYIVVVIVVVVVCKYVHCI